MKTAVWIPGEAATYARYAEAVRRAGGTPCFDGSPDDCAALLLPGGGDIAPSRYGQSDTACRRVDPVRDELEFRLLDRFVRQGKPVLGVCRGMQCINVYFGGSLLQHIDGHSQRDGVDRTHAVRTAPGPFAALDASIVNSAHHQAADRLGDGLRVEQWSADGVAEAVCHTRLPVWGVQWHPERLPGPVGGRLFRAFLALCADR